MPLFWHFVSSIKFIKGLTKDKWMNYSCIFQMNRTKGLVKLIELTKCEKELNELIDLFNLAFC